MRPRPIFWKIFPSYLLIVLISLFVVSLHTFVAVRTFYVRQVEKSLKARASLAGEHLINDGAPLEPEMADNLCNRIGLETGTRYTFILPTGEVIGDSERDPSTMDDHAGRQEVAQALRGQIGVATRHSATLGRKMMYVAYPLESGGRTLGVIRTSTPLDSIRETLWLIHRKLGAVLILVLASAIVVGLVVSRRIAGPIEEMKKGAERLARGDLTLRLPPGQSAEMTALSESITKLAEDLYERIHTLAEERNEREAIFSGMREGLLAIDPEERIIHVNRAACEMLGIDEIESRGKNLRTVIRNADLFQMVDESALTGERVERDIVIHRKPPVVLQANVAPLLDPHSIRIGAVIVMSNVTRVRQLEQVRKDFVTNVSHELRTPITSIVGSVETLLDGAANRKAERERFLQIIRKKAHGLNSIVDDLLTLSSLESRVEREDIELQEADIRSLVKDAISDCDQEARRKSIEVTVDCPANLSATVHVGLLEHALINLIMNAIQYSDEGKKVRVRTEKSGDNIRISVIDEGCGIAPRHLPRIFERFYRVDKGRSRDAGGTGIGLSIVRHIAEVHGGRVQVDSTPGEGSTFAILIPANPKEAVEKAAPRP